MALILIDIFEIWFTFLTLIQTWKFCKIRKQNSLTPRQHSEHASSVEEIGFVSPAKAKIVMHVTSNRNLLYVPRSESKHLVRLILHQRCPDNPCWQVTRSQNLIAAWHLTDLLLFLFPVGSWLFVFFCNKSSAFKSSCLSRFSKSWFLFGSFRVIVLILFQP